MKFLKYFTIFIVLLIIFTGCSLKENSDTTITKNYTSSLSEIPIDLNYILRGQISNDIYLATNNSNKKDFFSYDISTKKINKLESTSDPDKYLDLIKCNDKWVVWIEHESEVIDISNRPYKWNLVAYNIDTKITQIIDTSNFEYLPNISKYSSVPTNVILENNILVYTKPYTKNNIYALDIVVNNLENGNKDIVESITNLPDENIGTVSMSEGVIAWSKISNLTIDKKPKYNFPYEDYVINTYDINTKENIEITIDDNNYYYNPYIHNGNIAMIKIFEDNYFYSEIAIYNLASQKVTNILEKNTNVETSNGIKGTVFMTNNYLTWSQDGYGNKLIYDLAQNEFLEIFDTSTFQSNQYYINPYELWDNVVYFRGMNENVPINSLYILE